MKPSPRAISILIPTLCGLAFSVSSNAQEADDGPRQGPQRVGQFVTLKSPINESQVAKVGNMAVELRNRADREEKEAVLVLEIPAGSSTFGQASDFVRRLTAADLTGVRTVAWIPQSIDGYHTMVALACHDIVMDPNASIGDIGRRDALPSEEQDFILNTIVNRRRNSRLSPAVAKAMMDPAVELLRVRMKGPAGLDETRFLTPAEVKTYQQQNTPITESEVVKDTGVAGTFKAVDAQRAGFLVARTVESKRDVAELYGLPTEAMREQGSRSQVDARLIRLDEPITPLTEEFILRQIRLAVAEGANLLIFDIESPGGMLFSSVNIANAIADLDPAEITTVAWVEKQALSGAAVIAFGTDRIIMKPDAHIGDAGVIQETAEGGAFERVPEKLYSDFLVTLQNLAERKNRPTALLQAMVDKNLTVYEVQNAETGRVTYMSEYEIEASNEEWIKGAVVPESREEVLLTLNGQRAHELQLADEPAADFDEVRTRLGIPETNLLEPVARTWVDTFVWFLNTQIVGFFLITLAILCIYLELHLPSGFFGICAVLLFSLFFWSRYLGGTAGSLELIMFLLGLGLIALEIFVIPGFGVFGVSGILLLAGSLVMASHTFAGMSAGERFNESMSSLGTLAGALLTVVVVAVVLNRYLPSIPFVNRLILAPPGAAVDEDGPHLDPSVYSSEVADGSIQTGDIGVASSTLRPAGKASFGDLFVDVVSDGGYIDHGTQVEVIRVSGNRIVVRPAVGDSTA
ncbi:MAG: hypothetical protein Fues2KO_38610 [Fuerstiella sp.]